ncbi:MAG: hypothetical protein ACKO45_08075 [Cyanobium sp.]
MDPLEPLLVARFRQGGFVGAVGEIVAHAADGVEGLLDRRFDQAQAGCQRNLGAVAAQGSVRREQLVVRVSTGGHHGLEQMLQGQIQPGGAHQHQPSTPLGHHLQRHITGLLGSCQGE